MVLRLPYRKSFGSGSSARKPFALFAAVPVAALALAGAGLAAAGYFDRSPLHYEEPLGPRQDGLVVVYFAGDMGLSLGAGRGTINALRTRGIPVLAVNSPALFLRERDRTFVDGLVAESLKQALRRSGAAKVALIGSAFGADILDTGIGALPADLRERISSVVLVVPDTRVFFRADPGGLFRGGTPDSNPRRTTRLLRGLSVTCVFGTHQRTSLCHMPELGHASLIGLDDGRLTFNQSHWLAETAANAAQFPPAPML